MNVASKQGVSTLHRSARGWASIALLSLTMGAGVASCSLMVDSEATQCKKDADCAKRFRAATTDLFCRDEVCVEPSCTTDDECQTFGDKYKGTVCRDMTCKPKSEEPPEWVCLDDPPPAVAPQAGPWKITGRVADIVVTSKVFPNAKVMLCNRLDFVSCAAPVATATTDETGAFTVSLPGPTPFSGFVTVTVDGYLTTDYYVNPPISADTNLGNLQMATRNVAEALATAGDATLLADRGFMLITAQNCLKQGAAGIEFTSPEADDKTIPFYLVGMFPSKEQTVTEAGGLGGFINVKAGYFNITARRVAGGKVMGRTGVQMRTGNSLVITRIPAAMQPKTM